MKEPKLPRPKRLVQIDPSITYRLFNPQVPVVVCSKFREDIAAMPANSCSSVSESPPMVAVAIRNKIRTNRILRRSSLFSINWVSFQPKASRKIILELAKPFEAHIENPSDKLKQHGIAYTLVEGIPVLRQACAFALCKVMKLVRTGDHDLFISTVTSAKALDDFAAEGYWRFKDYKPVLYVGSIRPNPLITISDAGF